MKLSIIVLQIAMLILVASPLEAASMAGDVVAGNRHYRNQQYDEALEKYNEAEARTPESDVVNFNKGTVLYKKGDYGESLNSFTKALTTENADVEAKAYYNIGNAKYRMGTAEAGGYSEAAMDILKEALVYYKKAIEADESDVDAKYNYEFVTKKLEELEAQAEQQQQKQEQQGGEDKEQEEQEQGEGQQEEDKQGEEQKDQPQQPEQGEEQDEPSGGEDEDERRQEQEPQSSQAREEIEEMSEEEARMLLEGHEQEESMNPQKKARPRGYPDVLKDW